MEALKHNQDTQATKRTQELRDRLKLFETANGKYKLIMDKLRAKVGQQSDQLKQLRFNGRNQAADALLQRARYIYLYLYLSLYTHILRLENLSA